MALFSAHERTVLTRLAEVAIPPGERLPGAGAPTIERLEKTLGALPPWIVAGIRPLVWALELAPLAIYGRRFTSLDPARRTDVLARWHAAGLAPQRHALRALLTALKAAHFDDEAMHRRLGIAWGAEPPAPETPRWLAQMTDGADVSEDTELEADVVVIGTGAGGAPLAYELALRGHAVVLLEEGRYHRRHEFNRRPSDMFKLLYRDQGMTMALGNVATPVWAGRAVGGTTVVNSGTCYRAPERTFRVWREAMGLSMFSSESMDGYYARVEKILGVEPAREEYLGGVAKVIARGAASLGFVHGPLRRNAPDCDGQGVCCFGCPTGAKRSTDVSYVPMALERGAALFASTRAEQIVVEHGAATGVVARCRSGRKLTIRAPMVAVAGGTLMTPLILGANGLANSSGMLGRNLSIHPAAKVMALLDEPVEMWKGIPQSYAIEQFAEDGIMFEGASTPFDVTSVALPFSGALFTEVMEKFANLASFGFMIKDTSRGAVRRGPGGRPLITYSLNAADTARIHRGIATLSEVYWAAGARRIFPSVHGFDELRTRDDLEALKKHKVRAGDLELTAYHPLGTARMGVDPRRSVVGPDHQTHDVRGLYVVDGAAVPSSLGVNPQVTIMAMATRAAEIMDRRLTSAAARAASGTAASSSSPLGVSP